MKDQERANKEIEVANWMKSKGYDRRTYKDIAPIIVKYTEEQLAIDSVRERLITALDTVCENNRQDHGSDIYIGYHKGQWNYSLSEIDSDDLIDQIIEEYKNAL